MKRVIFFLGLLSLNAFAFDTHPLNPGHPGSVDDPKPNPLPKPKPAEPEGPAWTLGGARFVVDFIRQACRNQDHTRCEDYGPAKNEGVKVIDRATGNELFRFDRNAAEYVQQDYAQNLAEAEEHHPWSHYIARKESEKSDYEYLSIACSAGFGTYCGGMAAKIGKYGVLIATGCAALLQTCQKWIKEQQAAVQKEIDKVLAACAKSDQECFDTITGGQETAAKIQNSLELSAGERPPHTPATGIWAPGRPLKLKDGWYYDPNCCVTITEGDD